VAQVKTIGKDERERVALIAAVDLFSALIEEDLRYVASRSCFRSVKDGDTLFSAGEAANQFFIIKSGSVSVRTDDTRSDAVELARYVPGDVFCDFHFVIGGAYDATARVCGDSELLVFPGDGLTFDRLASEKPDTAARILLRSITLIEERIKTTRSLIAENKPWIRELRKLIFVDQPTGLWNKSFVDSELPQLLEGSATVIMVKPDNFKEINDTLGHIGGDEILRKIAALLMTMASKQRRAWAVRLRSNEMGLVVSNSDFLDLESLSNAIQRAFPEMLNASTTQTLPAFSASIAIGRWPEDGKSWKQVSERTNALLQEVWKRGGARTMRCEASH
jgi:diguanylate cyclase (GGDEF)-like protein